MTSLPDLLVLALATYYRAITAAKLHGPFGLAERMRHAVYRRRGFSPIVMPNGDVEWFRDGAERADRIGDDWVTEGVSCPLCCSLYGALVVLTLFHSGPSGEALALVLAVAGGASLLYTLGRTW